jgi:transcriptional regulator with XRE-family HTH domain
MPLTTTFPRFLALRREALRRTQAEIAARCAVTAEAISMFETGRRKPSLQLLPSLADALRVDRGLLSRFALQSRAPEVYATLGLEPVEDRDLESADRRTPMSNPFVDDEEDWEESSWKQRAAGPTPKTPERPC